MRLKLFRSLCLFLLMFNVAASAETKFQAPKFNYVPFNFPITTTSEQAQTMFNQGMLLYYGFEWGESTRSFKEAARLDPNCAMCYWGVALSLGSKMNAPTIGTEYKQARDAIQTALSMQKHTNQMERALIKALALRFAHLPQQHPTMKTNKSSTFSCHNADSKFDASTKLEKLKYANAMEKVCLKFPNNNVKTLHAYALIEWGFWNVFPENKLLTYRIAKILESVIKNDPMHVGANHYYIHIIEPSSEPARALVSADRFKALAPNTEHLVHMPAHIYFLTGRFHEASEANQRAIEAFKVYDATCLQQGFQPEINYLYFHNYDFLRSSASMEGRKQLALSAAQQMVQPPFAQWFKNEASLQWFIPIPWFVQARFGVWDELLKAPKPEDKYQYALGMWHYVRGMAYVHLNNQIAKANKENAALEKIIQIKPSDKILGDKGVKLLKLAQHVLLAFIADANSNEKATISNLEAAMKIQDTLGYHEPPDWYFPVSEALGDAYLKWGHGKAALRIYHKNLKELPQNGWGLFGLANTFRQLGKPEKANAVDAQFKAAWKNADIPFPVSYFKPLE